MTSAIVLFSGGLDSMLTVRLLQQQSVSVTALNVVTHFHDCSVEAAKRAEQLGVPLVVKHVGDEYLSIIAAPRFGYGKAANPCIDCRVVMCQMAKKMMEEVGADFVATGEIAGQRPNSQKIHQLTLITRESGLEGKLVRPLSAGVLPPTQPELDGLLNRRRLKSYTGRGRTRLLRLGRQLDIGPTPQPSTGCLLCEKSYAPRVFDLLKHTSSPTAWDVALLRCGRQIRLDPQSKCVVARNLEHCNHLAELAARTDARPSFFLYPHNFNGPSAIFVHDNLPNWSQSEWDTWFSRAAKLILKHTNSEKYDAENTQFVLQVAGVVVFLELGRMNGGWMQLENDLKTAMNMYVPKCGN